MKIILCRRGLGPSFGGYPSPILPDGTLLSIPIPSEHWVNDTYYENLNYNGKNFAEILNEILECKHRFSARCHLDTAIRTYDGLTNCNLRRSNDWKPSCGVNGSSLQHLFDQGVKIDDIFLFFGLFREAEIVAGRYRFVKGAKEKYIIWGYLQIGKVLHNPTSKKYPWFGHHPYLDVKDELNSIFLARDTISWDRRKPGSGCLDFNQERLLTKDGMSPSIWELHDFLMETDISCHNDENRVDGLFNSNELKQEFVFSADDRPEIIKWVSRIIDVQPPLDRSRKRMADDIITKLDVDEVFVFGSNLEGNHAGGAARQALQWGAILGVGEGLQGKTYAIPTMFETPDEIKPYVDRFIAYAKQHPYKRFLVTQIGCGIAGFKYNQIAPLFSKVIVENIINICLPRDFVLDIITGQSIGKD